MFGILVVDDEPIIADSLCQLLSNNEIIQKNCEIHKAYNAFEAQFIVENEGIELVLSDVNMPDLDGIEFRNRLISEDKDCYFIFISGYSDFNNIYNAMKFPNTRFILKSESDDVIIDAVLEQLQSILKKNKNTEINEDILLENGEPGSGKKHLIEKIDEFLADHLDNEACLTSVADYVHMSPPHLSRIYKQITGINFSNKVYQMKIDKAKQILRDTNKKVYEISEEVGFISASAFVYFFKKKTGMTPQQYRNKQ